MPTGDLSQGAFARAEEAPQGIPPDTGPEAAAEVLDALRGIPLACAVFDPAGTLLWLSAAASSALGLRRVGTHFADVVEENAALSEWQAAAREALRGDEACSRREALSLRRLSTRSGPLMLVVSEFAPSLAPSLADPSQQGWSFTAREREVLSELVAGRSNKEIAFQLGCSVRTIDVHVSSILRKARCTSRAELIARLLGSR